MSAIITYPDTENRQADTSKITLDKILQAINEGGGGGGGGGASGQILAYTTTGPTADGITPTSLNSEAIAVKPGGTTFTWDSTNHVWDDV